MTNIDDKRYFCNSLRAKVREQCRKFQEAKKDKAFRDRLNLDLKISDVRLDPEDLTRRWGCARWDAMISDPYAEKENEVVECDYYIKEEMAQLQKIYDQNEKILRELLQK